MRPLRRWRLVAVVAGCFALSGALTAQVAVVALPAEAGVLEATPPGLERLRLDTSGSAPGAHQAYDFAWRHPRFELRCRVLPADTPPGVSAGATAVHCARNDDGEELAHHMVRWRGGREDLERLRADWVYFFDYTPKAAFGERRRCYQTSYYREGVGLVHTWLLYDDAEFLHSDWAYALPFADALE